MLNSKGHIEPQPGESLKACPQQFQGRIEFEQVEFTFPSEPHKQILNGISFLVVPGQKVAFVGSTGCGKSTSIKLIERFYEPTAGRILLDGRPIQDYDVHHLRRHMSVVAQDNVLFSTTIRENIIYGLPRSDRERITDDEIERVCRKANAWQFIQEFPRGLETYAGEKGIKLSGGQKQRLAIARAMIRNPTIVLLDEATSALDSKAEAVVQEALDHMIEARGREKRGCTIVIAHRLPTIKQCDCIFVLDKGVIVESGSHEELIEVPITKDGDDVRSGWYHDLWDTQMGTNSEVESAIAAKLRAVELAKRKLEAQNVALCLQLLLKNSVPASEHGRSKQKPNSMLPPTILRWDSSNDVDILGSADALASTWPPRQATTRRRMNSSERNYEI